MKGGAAGPASPFGARLRRWRRHRGISQLTLAGQVGSTPRHISFLETGRSRPSRQMVLRLGEVLAVSLRERNQLLAAAGLPDAYPQAPVTGPQLAPYRAAIDSLLHAHQPYPGMVLDSHWNVLITNRACADLFGGDLVGANMVRHFLANPAAAGPPFARYTFHDHSSTWTPAFRSPPPCRPRTRHPVVAPGGPAAVTTTSARTKI